MRSWEELYDVVRSKVPHNIVGQMLAYLRQKPPRLWGEQQPPEYLEHALWLALYKDLMNIGCNKLEALCTTFKRAPHKTLAHNIEVIREHLYEWAKGTRYIGEPRRLEGGVRERPETRTPDGPALLSSPTLSTSGARVGSQSARRTPPGRSRGKPRRADSSRSETAGGGLDFIIRLFLPKFTDTEALTYDAERSITRSQEQR